MTIRTAVIPAAGLGTRFLPATKAQPKGLLPIVDTPAIQLVVEEALAAGLEDVILVLGPGQDALRAHFAPDPALEAELEARGKNDALDAVRRATRPEVRFVVQEEALGLGHAVAVAAPLVGDAPFAVLLGDDLIDPAVPLLSRRCSTSPSGPARRCSPRCTSARARSRCTGASSPASPEGDLVRVVSIVEKPDPAEAPSDLAVIGRYVFTPGIFAALARTAPGSGRRDPAHRRDRRRSPAPSRSTRIRSIVAALTRATRSTRWRRRSRSRWRATISGRRCASG